MRILFDECMPFPVIAELSDLPHQLDHAAKINLAGQPNGTIYQHAIEHFDFFITNDRHFRKGDRYPVTSKLGIVFVRIAPCVTENISEPLRRLLTDGDPMRFVGRRIVLRRDEWQFKE